MRTSWPFLSFAADHGPLCVIASLWFGRLVEYEVTQHAHAAPFPTPATTLLRMHLPFTAGPFTPQSPRSLFHQKNIYQTPFSPERFYPKIQSTFAPWAFYTSNSLHKKPVSSKTFYLLHKRLSTYIRNLLHQSFLYHMPFPQKPLTPGKL